MRMTLVLAMVVFSVAFGDADAQTVRGNGLIVDADWVSQRLASDEDVVVLQVGPEELFEAEHIEGARFVSLDDVDAHGELALQLPEQSALREWLEMLGISDDSNVVVVHSAGWITPMGRIVFTLDAAGFGEQTFVLDGGLEGWKAEGHPVTSAISHVIRGHVTKEGAERIVTHEWVSEHARDRGVSLVDAHGRVGSSSTEGSRSRRIAEDESR